MLLCHSFFFFSLSSLFKSLWSEERSWEKSRRQILCACVNVTDHVVNICQRGTLLVKNERVTLGSARLYSVLESGRSKLGSIDLPYGEPASVDSGIDKSGRKWTVTGNSRELIYTYDISLPIDSFFDENDALFK